MSEFVVGNVKDFIGKNHKVSNINPMMTEDQLMSLMESISIVGQLEPIKIWRGMVIDGRNRLKALDNLSINEVKYISLPHKTSLDELQAISNGAEARRHQTATQLAIKAYMMTKELGISQASAASTVGVSLKLVKCAVSIAKVRPSVLSLLQEGDLYKLPNGYATDSLMSINKSLKGADESSMVSTSKILDMMDNAKSDTSIEEADPAYLAVMAITQGDVERIRKIINNLQMSIT